MPLDTRPLQRITLIPRVPNEQQLYANVEVLKMPVITHNPDHPAQDVLPQKMRSCQAVAVSRLVILVSLNCLVAKLNYQLISALAICPNCTCSNTVPVLVPYGGTGHKFCRLHRGCGWQTSLVEPTKLMLCTSVLARPN